MRVKWLKKACIDLVYLRDYIERDKPHAAKKVATTITNTAIYLASHPHMGKAGRVANTREFIIQHFPYIMIYRVKDDAVEILRIFHTAQSWPDLMLDTPTATAE